MRLFTIYNYRKISTWEPRHGRVISKSTLQTSNSEACYNEVILYSVLVHFIELFRGCGFTGWFVSYVVKNLSHVARKPAFRVSDQVRHKPGCTATEDG